MNVTMALGRLFNTSQAKFMGLGAVPNGDGGNVTVNYWGKVKNFSDIARSLCVLPEPLSIGCYEPVLKGWLNASGSGVGGNLVMNRDLTTVNGVRDVDIDDDGEVGGEDSLLLMNEYNARVSVSVSGTYSLQYDINNDGNLSVRDLVRVGFEYETR